MENLDIKKIFEEAKSQIGKTNILITGKTGVGKSTLINSVFAKDMAKTGVGKPITQNIKQYTKEDCPLTLIDTRGLELDNYENISSELKLEIKRRQTANSNEHIHIAWYCINYGSKRIEEGEINFIKEIASEIPVIVVLTQSIDNNLDFYNEVRDSCYAIAQPIRVLALPSECALGTIPSFGLEDLVNITAENIPEANRRAFDIVQKIDMSRKNKAANAIIASAATAAAAAGAIPIPFSDAAVLAPIQIGMLASISLCMGIEMTSAFLTTLVTSAAGVSGAAYAGRTIVSGLLKMIPGAGSVIGGVISATTAATLTTIMGTAYKEAIKLLVSENKEITPANLAETFKAKLQLK